MQPILTFLSPELTDRIIAEGFTLLGETGVYIDSPGMQERLAGLGARVDSGSGRVRLPETLVERCLASAPSSFSLYDITGEETHRFGTGTVYYTPGSAALYITDEAGRRRPSTDDYIAYVTLTDTLENLASQSTAFVPADVPETISDSYRLFLSLLYGRKPVVTGTFSRGSLRIMKALQTAVRGSEAQLKLQPLCIFTCCPNTPLRWTEETIDTLVSCAGSLIPMEIISVPMCGLISPVTLTGTLIQHTAENISGIVMAQAVQPGTPLLYGCCAAVHDMRYSTTSMGSVESMMLSCGSAEIGRKLGLPTQAYITVSDAALPDIQAGVESGMGGMLAALTGISNISGPGMLDYLNSFSLEKLVMDNEICGMGLRARAGIQPRDDFPAAPLMAELFREKHLLLSEHTRAFLRDEHYFPGPVIDRRDTAARERDPALWSARARAEIERRRAAYAAPELPAGLRSRLYDLMSREAAANGLDALPVPLQRDWRHLPD
ncbi:trimethylamine methyltransferase family protein [bacterium]|nr:trimethylamine methyltransferase family protein [bacterium]